MKTNSADIEVAIALPIDGTFTYSVPEHLFPFISVGKRVLVPFGRRRITGYVLGPGENADGYENKLILDIPDETPLFPKSAIPFFRWIADYYMYPIGEVIRSALPGGLNIRDFMTVAITDAGQDALAGNELSPLRREVLTHLAHQGPCPQKSLSKSLNREVSHALIRTLEGLGWVLITRELSRGNTRSKTERHVALIRSDIPEDRFHASRKAILDALASHDGELSVHQLKAQVPKAGGYLKFLADSGYISIFTKKVYRDPFGESIAPDEPPTLAEAQRTVVSAIMDAMGKGFASYLLAGVTGSGKTEVYLRLTAEVIGQGKSVLVLVPEISLISQMERRFRARFGENIAVLHSGLSPGERYDQWTRIVNHEVQVAIGARSAIFAPFDDIGMIIVDEEHDTSYKQESELLYNARDLAVLRAKQAGGIAVLGSATPSIQSCYNVVTKKFTEVTLKERVRKRPLPEIRIVDLRKNRDEQGIRQFITADLYAAMKETLARKEQILIFLNRRGFAEFPVCAACGDPVGCKNCDVTLTLHQTDNAYKCHYCGFTLPSASRCPTCDSSSIKLLGFGTEKVEKAIRSLFPSASVARMDRDTTARKGAILGILKDIRNHRTDILVGTQMVAKGHDFPNITLVGIICADLSLCFPDFRAGERTFQLLAQVAGRAGRGERPGRVILQTYNPQHFSIASARDQDFRAFYEGEIAFRKALLYPPFSRMIQLKISGKDKARTRELALALGDACKALLKREKGFSDAVQILGPAEASLFKIAKRYRWQILLKGANSGVLHQFVRQAMAENPAIFKHRNVKVAADVDPLGMF